MIYFPYRAYKNRPYIQDFLQLPYKERTWDVLTQMALFKTLHAFGERETIKADIKLNQTVHVCGMHESWLSNALADFFAGGQVIFHISPTLKAAFRYSELGEATAGDLKFPFKDSYIHIGSDADLVFNGGRTRLEGVLLSEKIDETGNSMSMTLVGNLIEEPKHWGERGMETFTFHFGAEEMNMPILEGAKKYLERLGKDPAEDDGYDLTEFDEESKKEILATWEIHKEDRRLHRENIPVVLECVRMVANALLYVNQYPDDMADDYQDEFPEKLRHKIESSQGKSLERNLSKARSIGFTLIKRVGGKFERAIQLETSENETNKEGTTPHMRRAHWRRQAFGTGLTQHKLIWIRSTRVLGGSVRERPYLITDCS